MTAVNGDCSEFGQLHPFPAALLGTRALWQPTPCYFLSNFRPDETAQVLLSAYQDDEHSEILI